MRWLRQKADAALRRQATESSEDRPTSADDDAGATGESRASGADTTGAAPEPPSFADLHDRHEAFFDVEWYSLQAGTSFTSRAEALTHAARWIEENGYSPHPLYLPTWGRVQTGKTRHTHAESYRLFLTRGWTGQDPHPAVDLEYIARTHPESVDDPDGVFGWLVKRLAGGESLRPVPGEGPPLDWPEFRAGQLAALRAQQKTSERLPRRRRSEERRVGKG